MDAVAYRTRARCREAVPGLSSRQCKTRPQPQIELGISGRKRLRKSVTTDSHIEELNNSYVPLPDGDDDHDDSVASNEIKNHDSGNQRRAAGVLKRKRCVVSSSSSSLTSSESDVVIVGEFQSKDCDVILSEPVMRTRQVPTTALVKKCSSEDNRDEELGEDEELRIVGMVGQVVTRDLPHPRPDCAEYCFARDSPATESNSKCCSQCYCYVCDVKASECKFWGTGLRERDHANARPHAAWNVLRQAARGGDKARVKREFKASGPLRMPVPSPPAPDSGVALLQQVLAQMEQQVHQLGCNFRSQQQQHRQRQDRPARGGVVGNLDLAGVSDETNVDADEDFFLAAIARLGGDGIAHGGNLRSLGTAEGSAGGRHAARRGQEHQQQQSGVESVPPVTRGIFGAARQHQAPCGSQTATVPVTATATAAASDSAGGLRGLQPVASSPRTVARGQQLKTTAHTTAGGSSGNNSAGAMDAALVASASHAPMPPMYTSPQPHTPNVPAQYTVPCGYPQQLSILSPPQVQPTLPQPMGSAMGLFTHAAILPPQLQPVQIELVQPVTFQPYQNWFPASSTFGLGYGIGVQQRCGPQGLLPQPIPSIAAVAPSVGPASGFALWEETCALVLDTSLGALTPNAVQLQ